MHIFQLSTVLILLFTTTTIAQPLQARQEKAQNLNTAAQVGDCIIAGLYVGQQPVSSHVK